MTWETTDENFDEFWDRIESSYLGWQRKPYKPPLEQQHLRALTSHRERVGRDLFKDAYLHRDNIVETREELADALMYVYLDTLKCQKEGVDPEWDVVLEIADDLLSAYRKLSMLRRKHRGAVR